MIDALAVIALVLAVGSMLVGYMGLQKAKLSRQEAEDAWLRASEMKRELSRKTWEVEFGFNRFRAEQLYKAGTIKQVPYEITDSCISCGACAADCPEDAIATGDIYVISPESCKNCHKCAEVCPTGSCVSMTFGDPFVTGWPESVTPGTHSDPNATSAVA